MESGLCYDPCKSDVSGGETSLSQTRFSDLSDSVVFSPEPNVTGDGDRPFSSDSDSPGETESHWTDYGAGFGDQFTYATCAPETDDTGDGDR